MKEALLAAAIMVAVFAWSDLPTDWRALTAGLAAGTCIVLIAAHFERRSGR
jgi:hypothetical protein